MSKSIASVHRFGDQVAVSVGNGSTTYLSHRQANALAKTLKTCAQSVKTEKFVNSNFGTVDVPEERVGYIKRDQQERFNTKRAWFVTAWRIVDKNGGDLIQPWSSTKGEARETAKACGITIVGELK